jgi:RNA polymerase sigma-70 factor (ECF subfamily)
MPVAVVDADVRDMERCRGGDAGALGDLFDRHAREVQRFLAGMRVERSAAEDAVQETFLRLFGLARRGDWDPARPLRPYVLGIARNVAISGARRRPGSPLDPARADERDGPATVASSNELRRTVLAALGALDDDARAALVLRHEHGLGMEELASALDCSVPTARARLREAAVRFAVELRRRGLDPEEATS